MLSTVYYLDYQDIYYLLIGNNINCFKLWHYAIVNFMFIKESNVFI